MLRSRLVFRRAIQSLLHHLELFDVRLARLVHLYVTATVGSIHHHLVSVRRIWLLLIEAELCVVTLCGACRNILSRVVKKGDEEYHIIVSGVKDTGLCGKYWTDLESLPSKRKRASAGQVI